jgi:hypothetical protein
MWLIQLFSLDCAVVKRRKPRIKIKDKSLIVSFDSVQTLALFG